MMQTSSGWWVALIFLVALLIYAVPIWIAARIVKAERPTLIRSAASLLLGSIIGGLAAALLAPSLGAMSLVAIPLAYVLSFKWMLGTSLPGAFLLGILALAGYMLMNTIFGGGALPGPVGATPVL